MWICLFSNESLKDIYRTSLDRKRFLNFAANDLAMSVFSEEVLSPDPGAHLAVVGVVVECLEIGPQGQHVALGAQVFGSLLHHGQQVEEVFGHIVILF